MARTTLHAGMVTENTLEDDDGDTKVQVEEAADEDKIRFDTAGVERAIITEIGRVGIGISTPDTHLHIKGTSPAITLQRDNNSNDTSTINFEGSAGVVACKVGQVAGSNNELAFHTHDGSNLLERMRIDNAGNIGIGTTSPAEILHIESADSVIRLDDTTSNYRIDLEVAGGLKLMMGTTTNSDAYMTLMAHAGLNKLDTVTRDFHLYGNNTTTGFYFDESEGMFGIGTTAPQAYLDIKNVTDDGTTNRTMLRLHNYRSDDANHNDWAPTSIDFEIENVSGGVKGATARIATVLAPTGTDHGLATGEQSSALIFSTMNNDVLSESMRINATGNLGIGLTNPTSTLDIAGSLGAKIIAKTSSHTVAANDFTIMANATGDSITLSLPASSGTTGRIYIFKRIDTDNGETVTIARNGSDTIDGVTENISLNIGQSLIIQSTGSGWIKIGEYIAPPP